jgi:hypothetical protein
MLGNYRLGSALGQGLPSQITAIPEALEETIMRSLEKDPRKRIPSSARSRSPRRAKTPRSSSTAASRGKGKLVILSDLPSGLYRIHLEVGGKKTPHRDVQIQPNKRLTIKL